MLFSFPLRLQILPQRLSNHIVLSPLGFIAEALQRDRFLVGDP